MIYNIYHYRAKQWCFALLKFCVTLIRETPNDRTKTKNEKKNLTFNCSGKLYYDEQLRRRFINPLHSPRGIVYKQCESLFLDLLGRPWKMLISTQTPQTAGLPRVHDFM